MTQTVGETTTRDLLKGPDGNLSFVSAVDAVALLCKARIEAQRNEMVYATDQGMPMRTTAFDTFNQNQFEAAARTIILATPDVTGVQSFSLTKPGNTLDYVAVIQTIYGAATVTSQ